MLAQPRYVPAYKVRINGQDIPAALRSSVTSVRYEDGAQSADRVEIGIANVDLRWLQQHIRGLGFRPFPTERIVTVLSRAQAIGVIDRDYSFGSPFASGVVANEIRAAMYNADRRPPLLSFICGLGGREVTLEDVNKAVEMCYGAAKAGKSDARTHWLGVRE